MRNLAVKLKFIFVSQKTAPNPVFYFAVELLEKKRQRLSKNEIERLRIFSILTLSSYL